MLRPAKLRQWIYGKSNPWNGRRDSWRDTWVLADENGPTGKNNYGVFCYYSTKKYAQKEADRLNAIAMKATP